VALGDPAIHQFLDLAHPHGFHADGLPVVNRVVHQRGLDAERTEVRRVFPFATALAIAVSNGG
jgi:hypothetical protein